MSGANEKKRPKRGKAAAGSGVGFRRLVAAEWHRLWKSGAVRLMALSAPLLALVSAKYLLSQNAVLDPTLPEYATAGNVPVLALSEMLITAFSGMMLVLAGLSVTEEYRGGRLRMSMLRAAPLTRTMAAKWTVCLTFMLIQLGLYLLCTLAAGRMFFPNPETYPLFFDAGDVTYAGGLLYDLKYYGLAALVLAAMLTVLLWIAAVGRSSTVTLGVGIGFLLLSYALPTVLTYFRPLLDPDTFIRIHFLSLLMIEWEGIAAMLGKRYDVLVWNLGVIAGYGSLFGLLTFGVWKRRDNFE
ncbi:hypothetical protein QWJ34_10050 [Saccharibacillus sp. CPCC 101409]|uniref:hypothetical protein n=1 Tax=Saccharibacillus sp. CPCC 101409 TaxID=3058041 RepID=UPI00267149AE|nr:hypothetical protein [Saccharibacillus sp. CPCC 101409]MDO3410103.1 hypothetical protein [Saccharibacillus sp. CPCC 101409]